VTAWKDSGKVKYCSWQLVYGQRTSKICSGYGDHVIMTFCKKAFRASTGHHNASTTTGSDGDDRSTKWISHNYMVTYMDRQRERDSTECIVNDPIHTHMHAHALFQQLVACLFMYFPQVLKIAVWLLLTHQHQSICLYYSGWQSTYFPEHRGIHLCMLDLFTAHYKPKWRPLVKAVHADGPVD
jgi:hypothetical protein